MLDIRVIAIGKQHDAMFAAAIKEYQTRLRRHCNLTWDIIGASDFEQESASIIRRLRADATTLLLDQRGTNLTSDNLTQVIDDAQVYAAAEPVFIIGGAYGVTPEVRQRADRVVSLGPLVFPHQLVRVILLEQLYRGYDTLRGGGYHHA